MILYYSYMARGYSSNFSQFLSNLFHWLVRLSFLLGGLSIIFTGLFGGIYLSAYPFHSDPCDGLVGTDDLKENEANCAAQFVTRGYVPTANLINSNLLPADFADANKNMCTWNSNVKKCLENAGTNAECVSDLDDDGVRKNRHGNDGKCKQTKVPEICKQTGFKADALDKLVDVGTDTVVAMTILWIVFGLGVLSFLNIVSHMEYGVIPCPGGAKIDLTAPCKLMTNIDVLNRLFAKKNKTDGRFANEHESFAVCCTLLLHDALIVVFGILAWNAHDVIKAECYDVKYPSGKTAVELLSENKDKDAYKFYDTGSNMFEVFRVFWWINTICAAVKIVGFLCARENTSDMNVTIPEFEELLCRDDGDYGSGVSNMNRDKNSEFTSVQLRGQF